MDTVTLEEVEAIAKKQETGRGNDSRWYLVPRPVAGVGRAEFKGVLKKARVALSYDEWSDANKSARELSDVGGIERVDIFRSQSQLTKINRPFRDGKQR